MTTGTGNRQQTLIGQNSVVGFRNLFNNIIADVYQVIGVDILDPNLVPVYHFNPGDVQHTGLGTYQIEIPGSVFTQTGTYYDVWNIVPTDNTLPLNLRFSINVVSIANSTTPDWRQILDGGTLADLDACYIKRYYLWPVIAELHNYAISDRLIQHHIDTAITWTQRKLNMPLREMRVLTFPYDVSQNPPNPVLGVDYDEEGDLLQWSSVSSMEWANIRLPRTNILRVSGVRGIYGGQVVYTIPFPWIDRNEFKNGIIRIRPTAAGAINSLVDNSGRFLETTLLEARGATTVPGFWAVDYSYGSYAGRLEKELLDCIAKKASCLLLDQLATAISKGLSVRAASVDGLSTSLNYIVSTERTMFSALCARYEEEISEENLLELKRYYKAPFTFLF